MGKNKTTRNQAAKLCQLLASNYLGRRVAMSELSKNKKARSLALLAITWARGSDEVMAEVFAEAESMLRTGWKIQDRGNY